MSAYAVLLLLTLQGYYAVSVRLWPDTDGSDRSHKRIHQVVRSLAASSVALEPIKRE